MAEIIQDLQGKGVIITRPVRTTGVGKGGKKWQLYKFEVSMPDGKHNFSTWNTFGDDLQPGQRVEFIYSTRPNTWVDKDSGETRENIQYQMDTLIPPDPDAPQGPQTEHEAVEDWAAKDQTQVNTSRYEGWQIGQARNLAAAAIGAASGFESTQAWWRHVEITAAFILPLLGKEPMANHPASEAPSSSAQESSESKGSGVLDGPERPMYMPDGSEIRYFENRGEFMKAASDDLYLSTTGVLNILEVKSIDSIAYDDPEKWALLVATHAKLQSEKAETKDPEDLPW